jgi:hypothetical protein
MAEALRKEHTRRRGLLREWCCPNLVFDKLTAPVPEVMDDSL